MWSNRYWYAPRTLLHKSLFVFVSLLAFFPVYHQHTVGDKTKLFAFNSLFILADDKDLNA